MENPLEGGTDPLPGGEKCLLPEKREAELLWQARIKKSS